MSKQVLGWVPGPLAADPAAPLPGKKVHLQGTAATAAAGVTGTALAGGSDWIINIVCNQAFNITFTDDGTSTITNPADNSAFPAGSYRWRLSSKNSHFEFTPVANCILTHWLDRA